VYATSLKRNSLNIFLVHFFVQWINIKF
jgi:hypothetical protein